MSEAELQADILRLLRLLVRNPDTINDIAKRLLFLGKRGVLPPRTFKIAPSQQYTIEDIQKDDNWTKFTFNDSLSKVYFTEVDNEVGGCDDAISISLGYYKGKLAGSILGSMSAVTGTMNIDLLVVGSGVKDIISAEDIAITSGAFNHAVTLSADTEYLFGVTMSNSDESCSYCLTQSDSEKGWTANAEGSEISLGNSANASCSSLALAVGGGGGK